VIKSFRKEFEEKIITMGFSFISVHDEFYNLRDEYDINHSIKVQLIKSISENRQKYGSKNGNCFQALGLFKFKQVNSEAKPDFLVFAFRNPHRQIPEYLIIPEVELESRHIKSSSDSTNDKLIKIMFWVMTDGSVFNTTNISPEGEWYYMSKGINGRMADKTDGDYTKFLNNWDTLRL